MIIIELTLVGHFPYEVVNRVAEDLNEYAANLPYHTKSNKAIPVKKAP